MAEIIAFASGKGGTGKSTAAANIGAALAKLGENVLLLDMDMGQPSLDAYLGVTDKASWNLLDVFENSCTIRQAILPVRACNGLSVIPASAIRGPELLNTGRLRKFLEVLDSGFDRVLMDLPPGSRAPYGSAVALADRTIFVSTQDRVSALAVKRMADSMEERARMRSCVILNRVRTDLVKLHELPPAEEAAAAAGLPVLGIIPEDVEILLADEAGAHCVNLPTKGCRLLLRQDNAKSRLTEKG